MVDLQAPPDPDTLAWADSVVGPSRIVSRFAHDHGNARLWRLEAAGDAVWLKMHAQPRKWAGEVHALSRWNAPLVPTLLGAREAPPSVLLTEVPGLSAESIAFGPLAEARLWAEAGAWLRDFHRRSHDWLGDVRADGAPWSTPSRDAQAHVRATMEARLRQGRERGLLDPSELDYVRGAFRDGLPSLAGATFHAVHRDFHPRNWLAEPNGALTGVIDFEHARWDVRAADLNRPWDKEFRRNPALVDAFYDAYGHPDARFEAQIQTLRLVGVVASLVWATEVGEAAYADLNRDALRRIRGA